MYHLFSSNIRFKIIAAVLVVLTAMTNNSCHQVLDLNWVVNGKTTPISLVDTSFNRLFAQELGQNLSSFQCPGAAIVVINNNQVVFEKTFGTKSRYNDEAIDANTVFRLGSVSKGFAGILAALLVEKNMIKLDDAVSSYVPELTLKAKSKDKILRVKHILSHSSGLTEHAYSNLVDDNRDIETLIKYLNKLTPRDSTGKAYAYQNAAFGLIEKVIESATGLSYHVALDKYIFSPLSMCSSSCTYFDIKNAENVCVGHKYGGKRFGLVPIELKPHYYNLASAGGVNAPLNDMKIWLSAVMGYKPEVLGEKARNLAFCPYVNTSNDDKYFNSWPGIKDSHYGLGWRLIRTQQNNLVYHGGLVNGFRSEIAFDKEKNIGIVVLFNSVCGYSNHVIHEFFEFWNSYHAPIKDGYL